MDGRKIGGTVLVIALLVGARLYFRGDDSKRIRSDATRILQTMDCYKANEKVLDEMADVAHDRAFDQAYDLGTRRRGAKFDEDKYLQAFFQSMIDQARTRNRKDLQEALLGMKQITDAIAAGGSPPESSAENQAAGDSESVAATDAGAEGDLPPTQDSAGQASAEEAPQPSESTDNAVKLTEETIASMSDADLITAVVDNAVSKKAEESRSLGELAKAMPEGKRAIFCVSNYESVCRKSGYQGFFEDCGELTSQTLTALKTVGSKKHYLLFKKAIAAYLRENPEQESIKRTKSIKTICKKYEEGELTDFDEEFKKCKEKLKKLQAAYIREHAAEFVSE